MSRAVACAVVLLLACTDEHELFSDQTDADVRSACTERYGHQNGFMLCFEVGMECGFEAVKDPGQTCDQLCAAGGGRCLRVYGNLSTDNHVSRCQSRSTAARGSTCTTTSVSARSDAAFHLPT
jgi:hypothetical protein